MIEALLMSSLVKESEGFSYSVFPSLMPSRARRCGRVENGISNCSSNEKN